MNISPTVDLIELVVFVLGIIGLAISLVMLSLIQGDRHIIHISKSNGINKRLANADLRNELSRTYKLLGFTVAAFIGMLVEPPVRESSREAGMWFLWLLISWEVLAVVNSLWSFVDRIQNRDELREIDQVKKLAASKLAEAQASSEHDTAQNTMNAAANISDAAANASDAAANASDAAANAEDSLANSANAATNAARATEITQQQSGNRGK